MPLETPCSLSSSSSSSKCCIGFEFLKLWCNTSAGLWCLWRRQRNVLRFRFFFDFGWQMKTTRRPWCVSMTSLYIWFSRKRFMFSFFFSISIRKQRNSWSNEDFFAFAFGVIFKSVYQSLEACAIPRVCLQNCDFETETIKKY